VDISLYVYGTIPHPYMGYVLLERLGAKSCESFPQDGSSGKVERKIAWIFSARQLQR